MNLKSRNKSIIILFLVIPLIIGLLSPAHYISAQQDNYMNGCGIERGLDIVLVMDNSGSMQTSDSQNIRIQAANNMMAQLQDYDRMAIIKFNEEATNVQSLTSNRTDIKKGLDSVLPNTGGTDLSLGLEEALKEFSKNGGSNHKIIIVLTDGDSINNAVSLSHADTAYQNNITIYTIGLGASVNTAVLQDIANKTGGTYSPAANANHLTLIFDNIRQSMEELRNPKLFDNRKLNDDLHIKGDYVLHENVKLDLNGYDLKVDGDLVLLSCSELRAVSGVIEATNVEQKAGSIISLNNSQLVVEKQFTQDGHLRVNGNYGAKSEPEILINGDYLQQVRGSLHLEGYDMIVEGDFVQEGSINNGGGTIRVRNDATQRGYFDLEQGNLFVEGNLTIEGGPLVDEEFKNNRSLNVNGGLVQVGSEQSMKQTSSVGNVVQNSGQLYVNGGVVNIFGDYTIKDGWLTMINGSMDTTSEYTKSDGEYVHVYGDFTTQSMRNHGERNYQQLGKPLNDLAHLTEGVLQVDGDFKQYGDRQYHSQYSDRSQNYLQDYSRFNFVADGRHKVLLTGKGTISVESSNFKFNILELEGSLEDYTQNGVVRWNQLIERNKSDKAKLSSLSINNQPVHDFNPNVFHYYHVVPASTVEGPVKKLLVDARAEDRLNATVEVFGDYLKDDGTGQVKVVVTAHDGKTQNVYTIYVSVGNSSKNAVSSIELDKEHIVFLKNVSSNSFTPDKSTIGYTIKPTTAENQMVHWESTDESVATVSPAGIVTPKGVGKTTIIARTDDGGYTKTVLVEVKSQNDLLVGVNTLADFVSDNDRYNEIMSLYDHSDIGITVPGEYIKSIKFNNVSNYLVSGTIELNNSSLVKNIEMRINNQQLNVIKNSSTYTFSRAGVSVGDYVEVIAYNAAGNEIDRVSTTYPVNFETRTTPAPGFYSIETLLNNPAIFDLILDYYAPSQLRFDAQ